MFPWTMSRISSSFGEKESDPAKEVGIEIIHEPFSKKKKKNLSMNGW